MLAAKFKPKAAISAVYFEGEKQWTMVKRFIIETTTVGQRFKFITEPKDSRLYFVSTEEDPVVEIGYMSNRQKVTEELRPADFIEVKGWKAIGNKLIDKKLISIRDLSSPEDDTPEAEENDDTPPSPGGKGVQGDLFSAPSKTKSAKAPPPKAKPRPAVKKKGGKAKNQGFLMAGDSIEFDV